MESSSHRVKLNFFFKFVLGIHTKKATSKEKILTPNVLIETFYHHHTFHRVFSSLRCIMVCHTLTLHLSEHSVRWYCTKLWRYLITPVVATFHYRLSGNQNNIILNGLVWALQYSCKAIISHIYTCIRSASISVHWNIKRGYPC